MGEGERMREIERVWEKRDRERRRRREGGGGGEEKGERRMEQEDRERKREEEQEETDGESSGLVDWRRGHVTRFCSKDRGFKKMNLSVFAII